MEIPKQVFVSHPLGKMKGIPTITTSALCNPLCKQRSENPDCICFYCYAKRGLKAYKHSRSRYAENTELLSSHLLKDEEIPHINSLIARFESHGDLVNTTHAKNYIKIAEANPWCTFALWTKNPEFMDKAIHECGKPSNLICVFSSSFLNAEQDLSYQYPWIDHVFSVFTPDFIEQNHININCGAKDCLSCRQCYKTDTPFFIREKIK